MKGAYSMKVLTEEQLKKLTSRDKVKKIAVENFLCSLSGNKTADLMNVSLDAKSYGWNKETIKAIKDGITLAYNS